MHENPLPNHGIWLTVVTAALLGAGIVVLIWRRRRRTQQRKLGRTGALLSLIVLLLCLVGAEGAFAMFYDQTDSFMMMNVTRRWFHRHVRENNAGVRDHQTFTHIPASGTRRIVTLGDSFTFGHGIKRIEDRFTDRLRSRLEQTTTEPVELYNFATCGMDTPDHLEQLRLMARGGFHSDILLFVYTMTDASTLLPKTQEILDRISALQPKSWLTRNTYLFNFLHYRLALRSTPEATSYYEWVAKAYHEPIWPEHRRQLMAIVESCRQQQMDLRVVTFPLVALIGVDYPLTEAHAKLGEFWMEAGIPHVDLLPIFNARHSAQSLTVNPFDGHPNEVAHGIAAEAILEGLFSDEVTTAAQ